MIKYLIISWNKLELSIAYRSNAHLLNKLLQDWCCILFDTISMTLLARMKKNEFTCRILDSSSLACKIYALANDWDSFAILVVKMQNKCSMQCYYGIKTKQEVEI